MFDVLSKGFETAKNRFLGKAVLTEEKNLAQENTSSNAVTSDTYNSSNESSSPSVSIQFYCYTNPSFNFNNMPPTNVITNSNYVFEFIRWQNIYRNFFGIFGSIYNILSTKYGFLGFFEF